MFKAVRNYLVLTAESLMLASALVGFCLSGFCPNTAAADSQIVAPPLPISIIQSRIDVLRHPGVLKSGTLGSFNVDSKKIKGWDFVFEKLVGRGFSPSYLEDIFSDPRMRASETVYFAVSPKEHHSLYRHANTVQRQKRALACYKEHGKYFRKASAHFRVPETILLSILQVETSCGAVLGRDRVFERLARLVHTADPENIKRNYQQKYAGNPAIGIDAVMQRANWLENTFLPHLAGTIIVAAELDLHPLELRGSGGGAIGIPQFLPGNYLEYGVDGDDDKVVNLFHAPDAILSTAHYLRKHGWEQRSLSVEQQRAVIRRYNNSDPYIDTILAMASDLEPALQKLRATDKPKAGKAK